MRRMSWRAPSFLRPCQTVRRPKLNPTPRRALCILHTIREYQGLPRRGAYLPSSRFRADDLELESPEMLTRRGVAGLISNGGPHCGCARWREDYKTTPNDETSPTYRASRRY